MTFIDVQGQLTQMNNTTAKNQFEQGREKLGDSDIGQDGFMQLMLAQLRYQDPMNPADNTEQLTQQAQFTQIEELQKLNSTLSRSNDLTQASSLIGKTVEYMDEDGNTFSGIVSSAVISDKDVGLEVGGQVIDNAQLTRILNAPAS